jgi:hypothetical protein
MSLDNTSHPGRPGLDELVPSRYALRVGEIDVLVISDGVVTPPAESIATNADPAVRAAWLDNMFLPHDAFDCRRSRRGTWTRPGSGSGKSTRSGPTSKSSGTWDAQSDRWAHVEKRRFGN